MSNCTIGWQSQIVKDMASCIQVGCQTQFNSRPLSTSSHGWRFYNLCINIFGKSFASPSTKVWISKSFKICSDYRLLNTSIKGRFQAPKVGFTGRPTCFIMDSQLMYYSHHWRKDKDANSKKFKTKYTSITYATDYGQTNVCCMYDYETTVNYRPTVSFHSANVGDFC